MADDGGVMAEDGGVRHIPPFSAIGHYQSQFPYFAKFVFLPVKLIYLNMT